MSWKTRLLSTALISLGLAALGGANVAAAPQTPHVAGAVLFADGFNGANVWTTSHSAEDGAECPTDEWHQTATGGRNGTRGWTNDPYTPAIKSDPLGGGICLNHLTSPAIPTAGHGATLELAFWEHHFTEGPNDAGNPCNPPSNEPPCDFGIAAISKDGGATWKPLENPDTPVLFSGGTPADPYTEAKLTVGPAHFAAGDVIRIRFTFSSDALVAAPPYGPFQGWYIDDVNLCEVQCLGPTAVRVASFEARTVPGGVSLRWRTAAETTVLGFNVWRTAGGTTQKVNRALIAAKASRVGGARYRLLDTSARRGGSYTYRLEIVGPDGSRTWAARTALRG